MDDNHGNPYSPPAANDQPSETTPVESQVDDGTDYFFMIWLVGATAAVLMSLLALLRLT